MLRLNRFIFKTSSHLRQTTILLDTNFNISTVLRSLTTLSQFHSPPTLDYLTNTFGFTPDSALKVSNYIHGRPTDKLFSVLSLFDHYGFTPTHIATIFSKNPSLLLSNPEKILNPKLEFFVKNGISGEVLASLISTDPTILRRSLDKKIVPCFRFLKSFFGSTSDIISLLSDKRGAWVLHRFRDYMGSNIETLRQHNVPHRSIMVMLTRFSRTLSRDSEVFSRTVREIKELGFDPCSLMFLHAVRTRSSMRESKWVSKFEVFKSFRWSEAEIWAMFLKQPLFMTSSEEQLRRGLDIFMNKLGWGVLDISNYPTVISLNLQKRVLPRLSILYHLISKGLIAKKSVGSALLLSEDKFVSKFVKGYEESAPELLEMYQKNKLQVL